MKLWKGSPFSREPCLSSSGHNRRSASDGVPMNPTTSLLDRANLDRANLDRDSARHQVARGLEGADDGELFLEYAQTEALMFDNGRLKQATYDTSQGFGLR